MIKLGVNIDHIATVRQARKSRVPDPVDAAVLCEHAGCDGIVCHLREDRRHIQDRDLAVLKETVKTKLNLEMALSEEIIEIALKIRPDQVTLVPEKREELTTEGGLDIARNLVAIKDNVKRFTNCGIPVSFFIEPDKSQIDASREAGGQFVEIHSGRYADAADAGTREEELNRIREAVDYSISIGLDVNAGHGLDYKNVAAICRIEGIEELNIGYSIIGRALFVGITRAVEEMLEIMRANEKKDN